MTTDNKLKEIAGHLQEWVDCETGDGCGKCDEMRNIIKELTDIAEMVDKHNEKNTEAVKAKIRAATWKAFLQFEKYIESDDPITELKVKHDKFCTESGFLITDIAEAMQPEITELKISSFNRGKQYVYVTACCGYTPVTNEKFCPSCGRRIKK